MGGEDLWEVLQESPPAPLGKGGETSPAPLGKKVEGCGSC
jgi:hypothetical protein